MRAVFGIGCPIQGCSVCTCSGDDVGNGVVVAAAVSEPCSEYGTRGTLHTLGQSIQLWSNISPSLILFVFLPALLFESSFAMEIHQIKRCLVQMVLLAGPGVVISTFCTGTLIHYIFPYHWSWSISFLLGGLLSATDPVAVVALLKELGASKKLKTLIEGESLINDGTAIVIFRLFLELVLGESFNAGTVVVYLSRVALGGVALGAAFGLVSVLWLGLVFNDTVIEITLTLTASYIAYYTAEDEAKVSGVLAVMTVGIFFAVFARAAFKGETQQSMHYFWEMVAYIANTLIFILSGVVIAEYILKSRNSIEGQDWGYLALLYIFLQITRVIVVVTLLPGLQYFGYGLTWKEAIILTWAGLRGAVALALSLSVNVTVLPKVTGIDGERLCDELLRPDGVLLRPDEVLDELMRPDERERATAAGPPHRADSSRWL
ncbi:hypothetical protein L7F22_009116 [Adiantum nelumboides]|nr:hypothetical protein [Adiantum nelumboides]